MGGRTHCRRRHLRYLAHVLVGLHDALDAGDGELGLHVDAFGDAWSGLGAGGGVVGVGVGFFGLAG